MSRVSLIILAVVCVGLVIVYGVVTHCPEGHAEAILKKIPDPAQKHDANDDLHGWTYAHRTSEASSETYYFYHMGAKKPDAPVFVLIHGLFLDGRTFQNFGSLSESFELYALETPQESGFYKGKVSDFSLMLEDFLNTLKLERVHLGGVSLGGQIVMFYLSGKRPLHPQVDGAVLIATDMVKEQKSLLSAQRNIKRLKGLIDDNDCKMLCLLSKAVDWKQSHSDNDTQAVLDIFNYKKPAFYRQVMEAGLHLDAPPDISAINVPTLIVLGDDDGLIDVDEASRLEEQIPGAELTVIKGGTHALAFTRADEVTAAISKKFAPSNE